MADINLGQKTSRDGGVWTWNLWHMRWDSLALDFVRETLGLNGVLVMQFPVGREGLHQLDVSAQ